MSADGSVTLLATTVAEKSLVGADVFASENLNTVLVANETPSVATGGVKDTDVSEASATLKPVVLVLVAAVPGESSLTVTENDPFENSSAKVYDSRTAYCPEEVLVTVIAPAGTVVAPRVLL